MKKEDYLRELDAAGFEMSAGLQELAAAANPVALLRCSVARGWRWWLPAAAAAGFVAARLLRSPASRPGRPTRSGGSSGGAAFWVPTLLKLLPAATAQLVPLILSLRGGRGRP